MKREGRVSDWYLGDERDRGRGWTVELTEVCSKCGRDQWKEAVAANLIREHAFHHHLGWQPEQEGTGGYRISTIISGTTADNTLTLDGDNGANGAASRLDRRQFSKQTLPFLSTHTQHATDHCVCFLSLSLRKIITEPYIRIDARLA